MNAPTDAECNDQAVAFDILQVQVKALDQLLHNMADIDDMMDELDDAAKKAGDDHRDAKAHRQARAYKLTQIVLTAAKIYRAYRSENLAWQPSWPWLRGSPRAIRGHRSPRVALCLQVGRVHSDHVVRFNSSAVGETGSRPEYPL
jgi:hypothetical protein